MLIIKFYFIIDNLGEVAVMVILNMIFFLTVSYVLYLSFIHMESYRTLS